MRGVEILEGGGIMEDTMINRDDFHSENILTCLL